MEDLRSDLTVSRRSALKATCLGLAASGSMFASSSSSMANPQPPTDVDPPDTFSKVSRGIPSGWRSMRKIDIHNHVFDSLHRKETSWSRVEKIVEAAEVLGIGTVCCSRPITGGVLADDNGVKDANDSVLAAMNRYPKVIRGFCFLQPGNGSGAIDELKRCRDAGMIGVKLYNQYKITDPLLFPVVEACIEAKLPILSHSAFLTDPASIAAQPNTSNALEFCQLSTRYPELKLILGHVNGGGDWEWAIKGLANCPNVVLDTSGSVQEDGTIEMCIRELGISRVLFATDQLMEGGVGKILSAGLTPAELDAIFYSNAARFLPEGAL